jgi:hypothetical protein
MQLRAMPHSGESGLCAMPHCRESQLEYLSKYEFIFKVALCHESEDPGVLFAEKNEGQKSLETVILITTK